MTTAQVMTILRYRLDDGSSGAFSDAELLSEINNAKDLIEMIARVAISSESATISSASPTRVLTTVFNPVSVVISSSGVALEKTNVAKLCTTNPTALYSTGTPKYWYMINGTTLQLAPIPSTATAVQIYGHVISGRITNTSTQLTTIPLCLQSTALVDLAEANLRLSRSAVRGNADVAAFLMKRANELIGDYKQWS